MATAWIERSPNSCLVSSLGSSMYRIELTPEALEDLASLQNFDLRRVVDEIEVQLKDEPTRKRENENASARTNSPNGSFESKAFVSSMMSFSRTPWSRLWL